MYRNNSRKIFKFEALESRRLLDGNITVERSGNVLTLVGDSEDNAVLVSNTSANVVEITGLNTPNTITPSSPLPTTINGGSGSVDYLGVTAIVFDFNGGTTALNTGDDVIVITSLTLTGGVTINSGDGGNFYGIGTFDNSANFSAATVDSGSLGAVTLGKGMTINMGNGNDTLLADQATFNGPAGKDLAINAGFGHSNISFDHTVVSHMANFAETSSSGTIDLTLDNFSANYLNATCSIGNDSISLSNAQVTFAVTMNTNFGNDVVDFDNVTAGSVSLSLGAGTNEFTGTSDTITNATTILSGAQADTVTLDGYNTGSLSTGLAGGGNTLSLTNVTVTNGAILGAGFGGTPAADSVTLDGFSAKSLSMTGGAGDDTFSLTSVTVTKAASIDTGAGSDNVTIDGLSSATFKATLDAGDDSISVENMNVSGKAIFNGGAGSDTYTDSDPGSNTFGTLTRTSFETENPSS